MTAWSVRHRIRATAEGPDALAAFRAKRAAQKRLERARRRANGLTSNGTPVKRPDLVAAGLKRSGWHPSGCLCYDCLWVDATGRDVALGRPRRGRIDRSAIGG